MPKNLTSSLVDERIRFCRDYEKNNLGIKNGPDFAEIGRVLMDSKEFDGLALMCSIQGMVPIMLDKPKEGDDPDKFVKRISSATKEPLALMFYIGYRLGKAEGESNQLETLLRENVPTTEK